MLNFSVGTTPRPNPAGVRRFAVLLICSVAFSAQAPLPSIEQAIATQRQAVNRHSERPQAWNDLGNLLVTAERHQAAEEAYQTALGLANDHVPALFNYGLLLFETGRFQKAEELLKRVVELNPRSAWAHYQLGRIAQQEGRRALAIHHYATAFALESSLAFADVNPHVLENRLATEALLRARPDEPANTVPRSYDNPDRIRRLLVPPARNVATNTQAPPDEPIQTRTPSGTVVTQGSSPPAPTTEAPVSSTPPPAARRTLNQDSLDRKGSDPVLSGSGSTVVTPSSIPAGARRFAPARPAPGRTTPTSPNSVPSQASPDITAPGGATTPTRPPRFQPGPRSSAQLDLTLRPVDQNV